MVPRSWQRHQKVTERIYRAAPRTPREQQFLMVPANDQILKRPHKPHLVRCKAGDAIIWDSRTVHCSTPSLRNRDQDKPPAMAAEARRSTPAVAEGSWLAADDQRPRPARAVVYASMVPRSRATDEVLLARQDALRNGVTCTHWPFDFSCLEPPERLGQACSDPLRVALPIHKNMVGYTGSQLQNWLYANVSSSRGGAVDGDGLFATPRPVDLARMSFMTAAEPSSGGGACQRSRLRLRDVTPSRRASLHARGRGVNVNGGTRFKI